MKMSMGYADQYPIELYRVLYMPLVHHLLKACISVCTRNKSEFSQLQRIRKFSVSDIHFFIADVRNLNRPLIEGIFGCAQNLFERIVIQTNDYIAVFQPDEALDLCKLSVCAVLYCVKV